MFLEYIRHIIIFTNKINIMTQSKKKNVTNNRNLGIEILRMILCFWVVSFHCLNKNKISYLVFYLTKTKFHHVPCFSFISFYFAYNIFNERNIQYFKRRLERLLIPYIIWPLIIFIIDNTLHSLFCFNIKPIYIHDLRFQILFGRQFIVPLWFLFAIIFQSIVLFILSNIFKQYFLFVTQLLIICSYIIQYRLKLTFFGRYKMNVKLPILDSFSIFPLSLFGLNFASLNLMKLFKNNFTKVSILVYLMIYIFFNFEIFINIGGYNGIIHIYISLLLFVGFYILPFENSYSWFQNSIRRITSYTNGIYCLQSKIIPIVISYFDQNGTLKSSLISYILLYFISFCSIKIVGITKLKYLFI